MTSTTKSKIVPMLKRWFFLIFKQDMTDMSKYYKYYKLKLLMIILSSLILYRKKSQSLSIDNVLTNLNFNFDNRSIHNNVLC